MTATLFTVSGPALGRLWSYAGGTSTLLATKTDASGATSTTNPVRLDTYGNGFLWLEIGTTYKLTMEDATGAVHGVVQPGWPLDGVGFYDAATAIATALAGIAGSVQSQAYQAFTTAGTAPNFTLTPSPALASLASPLELEITFNADGTTGSNTVNIGGFGAKNLKQYDQYGAKQPAVVKSGMISRVRFDGVDMIIQNPLPSFGQYSGTEFVTPGAFTWTCPPGITSVEVLQVGSGGGGSGGDASHWGGGGGAGAVWRYRKTVVPGTTYSGTIGTPGAAGAIGAIGEDGSATVFDSVSVGGGGGGTITVTTNFFIGGVGKGIGWSGTTSSDTAATLSTTPSIMVLSTIQSGSGGGTGASAGGSMDGSVFGAGSPTSSGSGASSIFGIGGAQSTVAGNAPAVTAYGAGGSGGGKSYAGGAGRGGFVSIR